MMSREVIGDHSNNTLATKTHNRKPITLDNQIIIGEDLLTLIKETITKVETIELKIALVEQTILTELSILKRTSKKINLRLDKHGI